MKQVINRRVYNTDTAIEIASYSNGLSHSDFHAIEETLYRTKKGKYFLWWWGGAMTEYAETYPGGASDNQGITPFNSGQAIDWLEKRGKTEEIEKHFPDQIEEA